MQLSRAGCARLWLILPILVLVTACQGGENETGAVANTPVVTVSVEASGADGAAARGRQTPRPTNTRTAENAPEPTPTLRVTGAAVVDASGRPQMVVSASSINVRRGPGVTFEAFRFLLAGETATLVGTSSGGGWYDVELADGETGWVSADVVEQLTTQNSFPADTAPADTAPAANTFADGEAGARVAFASVSLRTGPGAEYDILRFLFADDAVIIKGRTEAEDWYFVETATGRSGWLSADVVELAGDVQADSILVMTGVPRLP